MSPDESSPQYEAAALFMSHKGLAGARPYDVDKLDDVPCWYFYYNLDDGLLELEVFWDRNGERWETTVTSFTQRDNRASGVPAGR